MSSRPPDDIQAHILLQTNQHQAAVFFDAPEDTEAPTPSPTSADRSSRSCGDLGWADAVSTTVEGQGVTGVCGQAPSVCKGAGTQAEAASYCLSLGARLCTSSEMMACEAAGQGCAYDYEQVWTSTPCKNGFVTVKAFENAELRAQVGGKCSSSSATCTTSGSAFYGRCCADTQA